jgi:hypothetical protein
MKTSPTKFGFLKLLSRCEAGSALVETALTLPIIVAMLVGAVEMGDLAYKATEMSSAARAAAQYAGMNGGGFTDCNNSFAGGTCNSTSGGNGNQLLQMFWR